MTADAASKVSATLRLHLLADRLAQRLADRRTGKVDKWKVYELLGYLTKRIDEHREKYGGPEIPSMERILEDPAFVARLERDE